MHDMNVNKLASQWKTICSTKIRWWVHN